MITINMTNEEKLKQRQEDYDNIRNDIMNTLKSSKEVFNEFSDYAKAAQHHNVYRAFFESTDLYIKNIDKLIQLDKEMANLENLENIPDETNITNNQQNIFVGTSKDLLAMLKKSKKDLEAIDDMISEPMQIETKIIEHENIETSEKKAE